MFFQGKPPAESPAETSPDNQENVAPRTPSQGGGGGGASVEETVGLPRSTTDIWARLMANRAEADQVRLPPSYTLLLFQLAALPLLLQCWAVRCRCLGSKQGTTSHMRLSECRANLKAVYCSR